VLPESDDERTADQGELNKMLLNPAAEQSSRNLAAEPQFNRKAVALLSGGLDSSLAIYLVKKQGIEVTALHFTSFFSTLNAADRDSPVQLVSRQLEVPLILEPKGQDFIELIRNPKYGHGKNINPCIDCRIYTFVKAKAIMERLGASFLVTGEVVGQRPMSQRRDTIRLIERKSGCSGIVVRPLSARVCPPSLPEESGVLDREQLLDVTGRGRKIQLHMAEEIGLSGYSPPAGGCLLTEQVFARRLGDLLAESEEVSPEDLQLLRVGRHIRIRPGLKIVVARNEAENQQLEALLAAGIIFAPAGFPGPSILVSGCPDSSEESLIAGILLRYTKECRRGNSVTITESGVAERLVKAADVAEDAWIASHMI